MKALFIELPAFERYRQDYLDDQEFRDFQNLLMENPEAGDIIEGTGGLRVIYYWWSTGKKFWLFTIYSKDEKDDLTPAQKKVLKELIKQELELRRST